MPPERMDGEVRSSWLVCRSCNQTRLREDPTRLSRYYTLRGLRLLSPRAVDRAEAHDAECTRCGTGRRVSVNTLTSGAPPCLPCDGRLLDPGAPHRVYLFEFADLHAYKVGITHCADDSRLAAHRATGGVLLDIVEVPDRATAFLLERIVLDRYRGHPSMAKDGHFPQGGWTECWDVLAGRPELATIARRVVHT